MGPQLFDAAAIERVGRFLRYQHLLQLGVGTLLLHQLLRVRCYDRAHFDDVLRGLGVQLGLHHGADLHAGALLPVGGRRAGGEEKRVLRGVGEGVEDLGVRRCGEGDGLVGGGFGLLGGEEDDLRLMSEGGVTVM